MSNKMQKARRVTKRDAEIGFRIRQIRQDKKISQTKVAEQCGVSYQQLRKYEEGKNRISVQRLIQISEILETDVNDLLGLVDNKRLPVPLRSLPKQNIDQAAANLWGSIENDRHKYVIIEMMNILRRDNQIKPQIIKNSH